MKKIVAMAMCLMMMVFALSANAQNSAIVGKWKQNVNEGGVSVETVYDFHSDGTMIQTLEVTSPKIEIVGGATCKYTYENNTITFKFEVADCNFSKFTIEGVPQSMIDQAIEMQKSEMAKQVQKLTDVKIEGDKMTCVFNGQRITLVRI